MVRRVLSSPWLDRIGVALLCLAHFAVACHASAKSTPTIDEFAHLPAGIVYLRTGSFRFYPHNPPLPRLAAALFAETQGLRVTELAQALEAQANPDAGSPQLNLPNYLLLAELVELENTATPANSRKYFAAFAWGRAAIALWSALTIPVLFAWAASASGRGAGLTAAALWAMCPTVIGHAGLVTTDVPAASLSLVAAWTFARWLDGVARPVTDTTPLTGRATPTHPRWSRALLAGLALGAALLTKFSVVLLVPLFALWLVINAARAAGLSAVWRTLRAPPGRQFFAILALALFVLNAGYLFEGTGTALDRFELASQTLTRPRQPGDPRSADETVRQLAPQRINRFQGSLLGMLPSPVPAMYLVGFDRLKWEAEGKYDLYLRGQWQRQGYWDYYLYGLLVKWPLGTWVLFVVALGGLALNMGKGAFDGLPASAELREARTVGQAASGTRKHGPAAMWLVLAAVPLFVLSVLQDVNLGLRYALPAFPFLLLIASTSAGSAFPKWSRWAALAAVVFNTASVFRVHPHELAYFNEAVGGPRNGRFHLIDSNLDWGQDLRRLAEWVERHPEWSDVELAYWGPIPPERVGFEKHRLAPRDLRQVPRPLWLPSETLNNSGPRPGKYAVSVNFERGMGFRTPLPFDLARTLPPNHPARHGATMLIVPRDAYAWLQHLTPRIEPEIGYSILLYDVSPEDAERVRTLQNGSMPPSE